MAEPGMQRLEDLYFNKVRLRIQEIWDRFVWTDRLTIDDVAVAETMEHLPLSQAKKLAYVPVADEFRWGSPWSTAWFRLRVHVPKSYKGQTVSLHFRTGAQCIIFQKGKPVQALDHGRDEYTLLDRARGDEKMELYVEAGASNAFGAFQQRTMQSPQIAILNRVVWDVYWDLAALFECVEALPRTSTRRARMSYVLNRVVDRFDYGEPTRAALCACASRVRRELKPLLDSPANASAQTMAAMGHAHIDVAWLWPLAETVRKCGRTFSNMLDLMDLYPEFIFVQSQPQLYEFTKKRYPDVYRRIKDKVRKGQWVPTGCMWVEADCNVTSGESLVRQVLFGTRFFKQEFDHDVVCLWLPDVFGYSAALPQILRKSGIPYFLTQKISWSQFSKFPYHSFAWEGIDGSTVLTHFPPVDTYNADLKAPQLLGAAERYQEKDRTDIQTVPFGYGDGGGGPNKPMLERLRRFRDLEDMPKVTPMAPAEFFAKLDATAGELPRWVGELYLELHRGTYTTQAAVKRNNRKAELMLREVEVLSAVNLSHGERYDQKRLNAAWKTVLLNQFHDIIPGSSIHEVYEDSARQFAEVFESLRGVLKKALTGYVRRIDSRGDGQPVVAFNSLSWERDDLVAVRLPGSQSGQCYEAVMDGRSVPAQVGEDGAVRFRATLPSVGHAVAHIKPSDRPLGGAVEASPREMSNAHVRVRFDAQGRVTSLYDKDAGREAIAAGAVANQFLLFEDKPNNWEAWDIDIFYNEKILESDGTLISADVVEQGPVRSVVRFIRRVSKSLITQDVVLAAGARRVEFVTRVAWADEKRVLLKVAFPVNVRSDRARYEIQFGNVERPTHLNRPDDFGRFEVPAQKWADLSEGDYGVALLNDCKYGHDTRDNVLRLTLLRATTTPDKTADVNQTHLFTYALYPHSGGYSNGVVRQAHELNTPVTAAVASGKGGTVPPVQSSFSVSGRNVVIDTIKKAEDDTGIVVRLYEIHGCRGRCTFTTGLPVSACHETDLMERVLKRLNVRQGKVRLSFGPFEIKTLKLEVKR